MLPSSGHFEGGGPHPSTISSSSFSPYQIKNFLIPATFSPPLSPWPLEQNMSKHGSHSLLALHFDLIKQSVCACHRLHVAHLSTSNYWPIFGCYNFFPLSHLFPRLHSTSPLLLLCSLLPRDQSIPTCFLILFLSFCTSPLVSPCSTGLSHSLVTSLMVTVFPLPSIKFYDLLLR